VATVLAVGGLGTEDIVKGSESGELFWRVRLDFGNDLIEAGIAVDREMADHHLRGDPLG